MSIYKRHSTWHISVSYRGQRIRTTAGHGTTKEQAKEIEAKIRAEIHAGKVGHKPDRLIADALMRWIDGECQGLKSARKFESHARALLPFIKGKTLSQLGHVAEDVKRSMAQQGLSPATINRRLALLRHIAHLAFKSWGWTDVPVGMRVTLLPEHNERHLYLTVAEVEALTLSCRNPACADLIRLAAYTGLRRGEILKLRAENMRDGCILLDAGTKNNRPRMIPVPPQAADIIQRMPIACSDVQLRKDFERARAAISRPDLHYHDLRHTYASWLVQSGAPLTAVRDLLGHSSLAVTSRYAHLAPEHLRDAVERMLKQQNGKN